MTLNLLGLPGHSADEAAAASQPAAPDAAVSLCIAATKATYGRAAVALGPPIPGQAAGTTTQTTAALADAVAAVYPVVQLLPVTAKVRCSQLCAQGLHGHYAVHKARQPCASVHWCRVRPALNSLTPVAAASGASAGTGEMRAAPRAPRGKQSSAARLAAAGATRLPSA